MKIQESMEENREDFFEDLTKAALQSPEAFVSGFDPSKALEKARVVYDPTFIGLVPILSILCDGVALPLLNECGISTIASHVKNGKTKLIWLFAQGLILGLHTSRFISHLVEGFRVAIFDSEQGRDRVQLTVNKYFSEETSKRVDVFSIRELSPGEMYLAIENFLMNSPKVKVAFIDIGSDLIAGGVNDLVESMRVLNALQGLAEKFRIHICLSVHLNKGDGQATGHFGSILLKRSEIIITVKKKHDVFIVSPLFSRDLLFNPFAFTIENGIAVPNDAILHQTSARSKKGDFDRVQSDVHKGILIEIFRNVPGLRPSDFKPVLKNQYSNVVGPIGLLLTRELQRYYVKCGYLKKLQGLLVLGFQVSPQSPEQKPNQIDEMG